MPTWLKIVPIEGNEGKQNKNKKNPTPYKGLMNTNTIYSDIITQIFPIHVFDNVFQCCGKKESPQIIWYHCSVISCHQYSFHHLSDTHLLIT